MEKRKEKRENHQQDVTPASEAAPYWNDYCYPFWACRSTSPRLAYQVI